ncbi:MAG: DEAD/DEAH box helicase, partial [Rubrivivax sp.]
MNSGALDAFFLDAGAGRSGARWCVHHAPAGPVQGAFVFAHGWAEEMNKSRRMVALQARAWAAQGIATLTIDLTGCGDSTGTLADATWDDWLLDLALAVRWMEARTMIYLKISISDFLTLFAARTRVWFWERRPGYALGAACIVATSSSTLLSLFWDDIFKSTDTYMVGLRRFVWHGDTGDSARRKFLKEPADLLLTTPESLEVMLVSQRVDEAKLFGDLRIVVIDEVHALAGSDRGAHLMSVLERIARLSRHDLQRVGLSATVGNPDAIRAVIAAVAAG